MERVHRHRPAGVAGGGLAGADRRTDLRLRRGLGAAAGGPGAISILLVLLCVTILIGVIGAAGVSVGFANGLRPAGSLPWLIVGGAAGGLLVGAFGKLLGHDSFTLLVGRSPGEITGGGEGL